MCRCVEDHSAVLVNGLTCEDKCSAEEEEGGGEGGEVWVKVWVKSDFTNLKLRHLLRSATNRGHNSK